MPTFTGATVTVEGGSAKGASIEIDGKRVPLSPEGIASVGNKGDVAKKLKEALGQAATE